MNPPTIQHVYVLKIRHSGEEDDVYVFYKHEDACYKAFEYFEMLMSSTDPARDINDLEEWLFEYDKGYFQIFSTNIQ